MPQNRSLGPVHPDAVSSASDIVECERCGQTALTAACHSKSCAPPPAGTGGSVRRMGGLAVRRSPSSSSKTPRMSRKHLQALRRQQKVAQQVRQGKASRSDLHRANKDVERLAASAALSSEQSLDSYSGAMSCDTCGATSLTAACYNKGCAPPPVGKGGSSKGEASRTARVNALQSRQKVVSRIKAGTPSGRMPRGAASDLAKARRRVKGASGMKSNTERSRRAEEARVASRKPGGASVWARQGWQKTMGGDTSKGGGIDDIPRPKVNKTLQKAADSRKKTTQAAPKKKTTKAVSAKLQNRLNALKERQNIVQRIANEGATVADERSYGEASRRVSQQRGMNPKSSKTGETRWIRRDDAITRGNKINRPDTRRGARVLKAYDNEYRRRMKNNEPVID